MNSLTLSEFIFDNDKWISRCDIFAFSLANLTFDFHKTRLQPPSRSCLFFNGRLVAKLPSDLAIPADKNVVCSSTK